MKALRKFLRECGPARGKTLVCGSKIHEGTDKPDRRNLYPGDVLGIDMQFGDGVDIIHDLETPLEFKVKFNHVDCVSTLEHVRRPWLFAQNVEDAMVEGGTILVMTPWVWREHAYPNDYFRYTSQGIRSLFTSIEWLREAFIVEEKLVKRVPRLITRGKRWLARSELAMFGRKCSTS